MTVELINLAEKVLSNYDVKPRSIGVIQSGGVKTVWRIDSVNGPLCLKRLRQTLEKALFTINAQNYMAQKGAKVPAILPTTEGKLYTIVDDEIFVLYQWIVGKNLCTDNSAELEKAIQGIAAFHRDSAGYVPPEGCRVSTKLGRWPGYYQSLINRLQEWKQTAENFAQQPVSQVYLKKADHSIMLGEKALEMLEQSCYKDWVAEVEQQKNLCHQDYGTGNAIITSEGIYVIDLDGVTYDLPARDLRKIINKRMTTIGRWDKDLLQSIINWYCQINPLTEAQLHVLYIDLLFPHQFHDTAKNPYRKNKPINAMKLLKAAKHEQAKQEILIPMLS